MLISKTCKNCFSDSFEIQYAFSIQFVSLLNNFMVLMFRPLE